VHGGSCNSRDVALPDHAGHKNLDPIAVMETDHVVSGHDGLEPKQKDKPWFLYITCCSVIGLAFKSLLSYLEAKLIGL